MLRTWKWLAAGLAVLFTIVFSTTSYAILVPSLAPFTPGTTSIYGSHAPDYISRDLTSAVTPQEAPGKTGLGNLRGGIGEIITPQTGSSYGAPNNHGFTVNNITIPIGNGNANAVFTLSIYSGTLTDGINPIAPTSGSATAVWQMTGTLFSDTFSYYNQGSTNGTGNGNGTNLATFFINSGPSLALDSSYLIAIEWDQQVNTVDANSLVWYRGLGVDPGGQILGESNPSDGFKTMASLPFGPGNPRAGALAINAVPEPSSMVILVLTGPSLLLRARCRKN